MISSAEFNWKLEHVKCSIFVDQVVQEPHTRFCRWKLKKNPASLPIAIANGSTNCQILFQISIIARIDRILLLLIVHSIICILLAQTTVLLVGLSTFMVYKIPWTVKESRLNYGKWIFWLCIPIKEPCQLLTWFTYRLSYSQQFLPRFFIYSL